MANENNPSAPLSALAAEACDLWQEHLSNYATDPQAKEELMRLMEPSRQMFAEWTKMVQNNGHGAGTFQGGISPAHPSDGPPSAAASGATRATASQPPSDDSALRLAQLSYRVADLKSGSFALNPDLDARLKKLIAQQDTTKNPEFALALADEGARRARLFIQGIKTYQRHPVRRHEVIAPVLVQIGAMRLRDYNPFNPLAPVILVIPSLINRFDIMDLDPKTSFLQSLAATGFRPVVIDWGVPGEAEKNFSLSDYILKLVIPALRFAQSCHSSAPAVHVMGYCMGGLLALALAQFCPESVRSLTLLATPWDFHQPTKAIGKSFSQLASDVDPLLQQLGYLPVDYIQMLFASLQPLEVITKFSKFGALNPESLEAQQFVILEDWLNDGVPLTAPVARACMQDWYGDNATARFAWQIDGNIIDPRSIDVPAYVVVPGRDRIVPPEAARPLAELLPQATLVEPMTGHVGMMTSRTSSNRIWMPLIDWLKKH